MSARAGDKSSESGSRRSPTWPTSRLSANGKPAGNAVRWSSVTGWPRPVSHQRRGKGRKVELRLHQAGSTGRSGYSSGGDRWGLLTDGKPPPYSSCMSRTSNELEADRRPREVAPSGEGHDHEAWRQSRSPKAGRIGASALDVKGAGVVLLGAGGAPPKRTRKKAIGRPTADLERSRR